VLTLADGEAREAKVYPDGSWSCPFCAAACMSPEGWAEMQRLNRESYIRSGDRYAEQPYPESERAAFEQSRCPNPACATGKTAAELAAAREAAARAAAAQEQRARADAAWRAAAEQSRAAEARRRDDLEAAALAAGQCLACLHASWRGRARLVRHRDPDNCPQRRRYQQ
jgi:hypothetical protein